jgi:hypothetical protein
MSTGAIRFIARPSAKPEMQQIKPHRVPLSVLSNSVPTSGHAMGRPEPPPTFLIHVEIPIGSPTDPQDVSEYEHIIYRSMRQREASFPKTLVRQTEISVRDRDFLVDWICRLHYKTQITTESLFRAVGILDRAIALTRMSKHRLHLIGAASLLIASKIEDGSPMAVADAIAIGQGEYTQQDLLKMEVQVANLIGFDTECPTILFFLTIFLRLNGQTQEFMLLARYLAELCLSCGEFVGVKPSALAATSLMMTRTLAGMEPWTEELAMYTQFPFEELCKYCKVVHEMLLQTGREESTFIRRKYASDPFCHVANVPVPPTLPLAFRLYD